MNIVFLTQALEHIQAAAQATFDPKERAEIQAVEESLLAILRKRGVFIGSTTQPKEES